MVLAEFMVRLPAEVTHHLTAELLSSAGYRLSWDSPLMGLAERGNKVLWYIVGALAPYLAIRFQVYPTAWGSTLRLHARTSLFPAGWLGEVVTKRKFANVVQMFVDRFDQYQAILGLNR